MLMDTFGRRLIVKEAEALDLELEG